MKLIRIKRSQQFWVRTHIRAGAVGNPQDFCETNFYNDPLRLRQCNVAMQDSYDAGAASC